MLDTTSHHDPVQVHCLSTPVTLSLLPENPCIPLWMTLLTFSLCLDQGFLPGEALLPASRGLLV